MDSFSLAIIFFMGVSPVVELWWGLDSASLDFERPSSDVPRLELIPLPDDVNLENILIWFQHGDGGNWKLWVDRLQSFVGDYEADQQYEKTIVACSWKYPAPPNKVCYFDIREVGVNCTKEKNFGYDVGRPCILVKMNRILDWVPHSYLSNNTDLPADMPVVVRHKVQYSRLEEPMVWLSCEGEDAADVENMGPISYSPRQGFPTYYFPDKNTPHYLSPFVFVQFLNPTPGVLISIKCKVWARNIEHSHTSSIGSIRFQLLMD